MALQEIEIDDDNDDLENEEESSNEKVKGNKEEFITNAGEIPLFRDADKRGFRAAAYLKIIKVDKPGSGFKGKIPIASTEETIAKLYGNGIYNVEACNHKHQIIRTIESLEISIPEENVTNNPLMVPSIRSEAGIIHRDNERVDRLHDKVTKQVTENSNQFVQLVTKQTTDSAQREREHMSSVNQQQQNFFQTMLTANAQLFQQQMAQQQLQHQQTLQLLAASQGNKGNDMQMLMAGIALAKEMLGGDGENTPDWLKALSQGGEMLGNLVKLSQVKKTNSIKVLKALKAKKLAAKNKDNIPTSAPVPDSGTKEVPNSGIDFGSIFNDNSKEVTEVVSEESESDGNIGESDSDQDFEDESGEGGYLPESTPE